MKRATKKRLRKGGGGGGGRYVLNVRLLDRLKDFHIRVKGLQRSINVFADRSPEEKKKR